jgi:hypothetical protein
VIAPSAQIKTKQRRTISLTLHFSAWNPLYFQNVVHVLQITAKQTPSGALNDPTIGK